MCWQSFNKSKAEGFLVMIETTIKKKIVHMTAIAE